MKDIPLSLCEKSSLLSNLEAKIRLDGRGFNQMRPIDIIFGKDYGCCTVVLGETRVLSQVTCEVVEPRPSRPNEGKLSIAVHLSPMAAPHFEPGKGMDVADELQQILDRNIKESRCVDLESLCILAEECVWQLKVDVTVLNHAGNLADASNLSAVSALRHFHRPDVTVEEDGRVSIHTPDERELIPTFLKRIPVCLSYALFNVADRFVSLTDPSEQEERVMNGKLMVGLNPHGEVTSLVFPGRICVEKHFIVSCISKSYVVAKNIADKVMTAVEEDIESRKQSSSVPGYLGRLASDASSIKKRILDFEKRVLGAHDDAQQGDTVTPHTTTAENLKMEVDDDDDDNDNNSSAEEFTQEELRQNLPEIRASNAKKTKKETDNLMKKKGKKKNKSPKRKNDFIDDEIQHDSIKLKSEDF